MSIGDAGSILFPLGKRGAPQLLGVLYSGFVVLDVCTPFSNVEWQITMRSLERTGPEKTSLVPNWISVHWLGRAGDP